MICSNRIVGVPGLCSAFVLASCAQIIGIEDLPPLPESDGGLPGANPDATFVDDGGPALASLRVSGIAPVITLMPGVTEYTVDLPLLQESVTVTATVNERANGLAIAGKSVVSGMPSEPIWLALGDNLVEILVEGSTGTQRAYNVNLRRAGQLAQYAYGKASNTGAPDVFAASMALSGDTLVVGAIYEDSAATGVNGSQDDNAAYNSGAVYVFRRTGTTWQQEAYLKASNTGSNDYFGDSVALSGDTLVVGAPREDSAATGVSGSQGDNTAADSGAAYVFRRAGTVWRQEAYLKASNTGAEDFFGASVALSDDALVVGAPGEDSAAIGVNGNQTDDTASNSGAVYVFRHPGAVWQQEAYLKASNTGARDFFGNALALAGDTLAIAAPYEASASQGVDGDQNDNSIPDSGAVYVFRRTLLNWEQEAYLKASNTGANDGFGYSLALSGDILAVGAPGEGSAATGVNGSQDDNSAPYSGAAYVFQRTGTTWQQEAYLKSSNTDTHDDFGYRVALVGEVLAVAAHQEDSAATGVNGNQNDNSASLSGAVYVFRRSARIWQQQAFLKASNTDAEDQFGISVVLSGDTLAIGASTEDSATKGVNGNQFDNSAMNSGAIYIFH